MNIPDMEPIPKADPNLGIYNNAENRWEYDHWGNVFVFSDRAIAEAQCQAQWHRYNGVSPTFRYGEEVSVVMEVREYGASEGVTE